MLNTELNSLLLDNVVKLEFVKKSTGETRVMNCTKAYDLLNSAEGVNILKYFKPKGSPSYNLNEHNNVIVWDIDKKDYRTVSCNNVKILEVMPQEKFLAILRLNNG